MPHRRSRSRLGGAGLKVPLRKSTSTSTSGTGTSSTGTATTIGSTPVTTKVSRSRGIGKQVRTLAKSGARGGIGKTVSRLAKRRGKRKRP